MALPFYFKRACCACCSASTLITKPNTFYIQIIWMIFPNKSDKLSFWQGINYFYFASPNLSK